MVDVIYDFDGGGKNWLFLNLNYFLICVFYGFFL